MYFNFIEMCMLSTIWGGQLASDDFRRSTSTAYAGWLPPSTNDKFTFLKRAFKELSTDIKFIVVLWCFLKLCNLQCEAFLGLRTSQRTALFINIRSWQHIKWITVCILSEYVWTRSEFQQTSWVVLYISHSSAVKSIKSLLCRLTALARCRVSVPRIPSTKPSSEMTLKDRLAKRLSGHCGQWFMQWVTGWHATCTW